MGKARSATIAATLITVGGTPAFADDVPPLAVTATGLTEGQALGPLTRFHPTWTEGATVTKIEVYRDSKLAFATPDPAAGLRIPLAGVANGAEVLVTVRVYENPDAWAEASTRVVVDTVAPSASFSPTAGRLPPVRGILTLTASNVSADTAAISLISMNKPVSRVEVLINGKVVARDVKAGYSFTINTKKYGKRFRIRLRAYDRVGNVTATNTRTWHR
jgi:hypothetical protein